LKGLPKADRKAIGEDIAYVQFKWPIGKPRIDHLRGPIREVRTTLGNRIARPLFAVAHGQMACCTVSSRRRRVPSARKLILQ